MKGGYNNEKKKLPKQRHLEVIRPEDEATVSLTKTGLCVTLTDYWKGAPVKEFKGEGWLEDSRNSNR